MTFVYFPNHVHFILTLSSASATRSNVNVLQDPVYTVPDPYGHDIKLKSLKTVGLMNL